MKKTNRRRKIRYDRIIVALLIVSAIAILIFLMAMKAYQYVTHDLLSNAPDAPEYYLMVGTDDQSGAHADAVVVVAINHQTQHITFISVPENTQISRDNKQQVLLKDTFIEGGIEETKSAVENLLHIRMKHFIVFDNTSFCAMMDKIGKIDFYVEKNMIHDDVDGNSDIYLFQGYQTLSPNNAFAYLRYIDNQDKEIGRWQRQERLMKAILREMHNNSSLYNWGMVYHYWNTDGTSMTSSEAASLAYDFTKFPLENITFVILPGEIKEENKKTYWQINPIAVQKVIGLTLHQEEETN